MTQSRSTERFSDRVGDYVKFRPRYPAEVIDTLQVKRGLKPSHIVVDVGSGTGISAELFLRNGNAVFGIEPNDAMRTAAENALSDYPGFRSQKGTSDSTGLADQTGDFIIAAQAFHWFEPIATKKEFNRIAKKAATIALIWNDRRVTGSAFAEEYESLIIKYGTDYLKIRHNNVDEKRIHEFLGPFELATFYNHQDFDFAGLLGRLTSSSYIPNKGQARYAAMEDELRRLFQRHQRQDVIRMEYDTKIYLNVLN